MNGPVNPAPLSAGREVGGILVVDDTPGNLKLLSALLAEQGYRMRPASSGAMALRSAAAKAPDLVLLDVKMPEMDGYEVCRRLKAEEGTKDVPVIFLSAASDEESVVEGFAAGGVDYIAKPIRGEEVIARVRTQMELSMLRRRLELRVAERTAELADANRALRKSENDLRLVIDATSDGVWDWDMAGQRLSFSDRWYTMLGHAPGEFEASYEAWRERVHPDDLAAAEAATQEHLEGRRAELGAEFRMRCESGDWKWILSRGKIVERDEAGRPTRMVGTHSDIDERKRNEGLIETALHEKEVLLKEVYHRVKNNLQVIGSLLNMQAREVDEAAVRSLLLESANRVKSMALVHEQLYQADDLARVRYDHYAGQLVKHLMQTNDPRSRVIPVQVEVAPVEVDIETAIPLGLIINELVSNAYKHAFPDGTAGEIVVRLETVGERLRLEVRDDGKGLPAGYCIDASASLGMRLVQSLADQIEGTLSIVPGGGACFQIDFPVPAP